MSQLQGILTRLKNLQEQAKETESAQRFFEIDGVKICQVTYFSKTDMFELEVYSEKGKSSKYQFDNIDMITIEIFDLVTILIQIMKTVPYEVRFSFWDLL